MAQVCASLMAETVVEVVKVAKGLDCDLVEVRLDNLRDTSDLSLLSEISQPIVATCMPQWEGGKYSGSEEERIEALASSLAYSSYVSVELRAEEGLRDRIVKQAKDKGVKVIVAFHDFEKTPSVDDIVKTLGECEAAGADVAKVAYMPKTRVDVVNVLAAQVSCGLSTPVIALSMGELGSISRVAGPALGGYLTFAAPSGENKTAPGQFSVDEMRQLAKMLWG